VCVCLFGLASLGRDICAHQLRNALFSGHGGMS
jgi:hypothetical protein